MTGIGVSGFGLKLFALLVMTLDHFYYFIPGMPPWMTYVGNLAAPIFLFLCVEGFSYTRSRPKYLLRMYCFSVLMKLTVTTICMTFPRADGVIIMNDMFSTMFAVCWCIEGLELLRGKVPGKPKRLGALLLLLMVAASAAVMTCMMMLPQVPGMVLRVLYLLLPNLMTCEGSIIWALLAIGFFYTRKSKKATALLLGLFLLLGFALAPITAEYILELLTIFASVIPICLYNGRPGKYRCKWLFYAYYPLHVCLLYLIG